MNNKNQNEPVAVVTGVYGGRFIVEPTNPAMVLPVNIALYTHPQQRKPLTLVELAKIFASIPSIPFDGEWQLELVRAIEAAHGIKEST